MFLAIVIGLGQPYKDLLNKENSAKDIKEQQEEEQLRLSIASAMAWRKQEIS